MKPFPLASAVLTCFAAGCSSTRPISVTTEPTGAMIQVDGQNVGAAPATAVLDFDGRPSVVVAAVKEGYFPEEIVLQARSRAVTDGHLRLVLLEDEAWLATTVSEATNEWLRVQVDESLDGRDVWQKLIDSVTSKYSNIEQLDEASGYVRTVTQTRTFRGPSGSYEVRTRFLASMSSRQPLVYKFRIESEITDRNGNWQPYGRVFKSDAELVQELQDRLGIK